MECVSKISAFYLCWLFHVDYRLSMLSITRRTCFLKRFIRSQYPSVHVPYEHWGLVISFCFCCLHQKYSCLCILSNAAIYKYFKQIKQKKKDKIIITRGREKKWSQRFIKLIKGVFLLEMS